MSLPPHNASDDPLPTPSPPPPRSSATLAAPAPPEAPPPLRPSSPPAASPPPATSVPPPPSRQSLTPAQRTAVLRADQLFKKINRAFRVARSDAIIAGFFGVTCLAGAFFQNSRLFKELAAQVGMNAGGGLDLVSLLLGIFLSIAAFNSFRGLRRLKQFDATAPRVLALNQLFLAAGILVYAAWSYHSAVTHPGNLADEARAAGLGTLDKDTSDIMNQYNAILPRLLWGGLAIGTLILQPLAAAYYFTRKYLLEQYLQETPQWVKDLHLLSKQRML